jgi:hypothetical protein
LETAPKEGGHLGLVFDHQCTHARSACPRNMRKR